MLLEHISDKVDDLRKGMSQVLESNHTLILGWSDEMIPILRQICLANESIGGSSIVILAEREKEEMESEIARNGLEFLGSQIICRSGNPLLKHDLDKVLKQCRLCVFNCCSRSRFILRGLLLFWRTSNPPIKATLAF